LFYSSFSTRLIISSLLVPERKLLFSPISASGSDFNPPPNFGGLILKIRKCILACPVGAEDRTGAVKIFALTRGFHAPHPYGQLDCCPILLSGRIALELGKTVYFSFEHSLRRVKAKTKEG